MNRDRIRDIFFPTEKTNWGSLLENLERGSRGRDDNYKKLHRLLLRARKADREPNLNPTIQESDDLLLRRVNDGIISEEEIYKSATSIKNTSDSAFGSEIDPVKIANELYDYLNGIAKSAGDPSRISEEEPTQASVELWNYYRQGVDLLFGSSVKYRLTELLEGFYRSQSSEPDSFWWYAVAAWIDSDLNKPDGRGDRLTNVEKSKYLIRAIQRLLRVEITEGGIDALYYTSLTSLDHIFPSKKDMESMKGSGIRLDMFKPSVMSVSTMNDPEEGHVLQEYLDEANKYTHRYWWNPVPDDEEEGQRYYCIEPYVFCKSFANRERLDDLSMWEVYGDRSEGVCCVVRVHGDSKSNLYNVAYLNRETKCVVQIGGEHKTEGNQFKFELVDTLLSLLREMVMDEGKERNNPKEWRKQILGIAYLFKYDSYSHENEMRYLDSLVDEDAEEIKSRVKPVGGLPIEKTLPILSVKSGISYEYKEVILGPKVKNPDNAAAYLIYKFTTVAGNNSVPLITKSAVRYR